MANEETRTAPVLPPLVVEAAVLMARASLFLMDVPGGCTHLRREMVAWIDKAKSDAPPVPAILSAPDSEGWWWHKFGPDVAIRPVTSLMGHGMTRKLWVASLGTYAYSCTGQWQRIPEPVWPETKDK